MSANYFVREMFHKHLRSPSREQCFINTCPNLNTQWSLRWLPQHNNNLQFCSASTSLSLALEWREWQRKNREIQEDKEKRKGWVWIDLKRHHNLPGMEQGLSVAHWQEPAQVPSKIYLSVLWCRHNVFLMSEIRLRMDEKALLLSFLHCFIPALMSIREADK